MSIQERQHQDPTAELITTYNDLNSSAITELDEEPSPLEFMRYVARNTPFVVRGAASGWKATQTWSARFLAEHLADETVNVAVTPAGNADSPTPHHDGSLIFAKPWEEDQSFPSFLNFLIQQELYPDQFQAQTEVRYAQTQNDNLRHEYHALFNHVQNDIPFARIALQQPSPDAINLWIGNSRSVTALHKDNYENLYVQILGQKHFVLLPPHSQPCVNEQLLRPGTYRRLPSETNTASSGKLASCLELRLDESNGGNGNDNDHEDAEKSASVPFAIWDPDRPKENATPYSELVKPMRVTLNPGDMLYLPCMWYHKVSQSCSPEGICVALNYWYDMEFSGPLYPLANFVRSVNSVRIDKI